MKTSSSTEDETRSETPPPDFAPLFFFRGIPWPRFWSDAEWESRLDAIADFDPRPDDVFVVSFPKSGHHWSHEFLTMIIGGNAELPRGGKEDSFLEYLPMEKLDALPSPRLILTHLPFQFLPTKILEKRNKIVRITRNPKDVCVSYYHHWRGCKKYNYSAPFSHYFEMFLGGQSSYGCFFEYERRYKTELSGADHRDHVFETTFESLKKDPLETFKRLGSFFNVERSLEFYREVVVNTSFDHLKAARDPKLRQYLNEGHSFYRKGQVGDWVNHLTVAQSRRIDDMAKQYQLEFVYELSSSS